jgi:hypothetical protein
MGFGFVFNRFWTLGFGKRGLGLFLYGIWKMLEFLVGVLSGEFDEHKTYNSLLVEMEEVTNGM